MADPCVFYIRVGGDVVVLAIHVDDTPITGSTWVHLVATRAID